jgi:mRNA-degrading endonuclease YafQ of YafQ-DinJ toxin-antitoxin module
MEIEKNMRNNIIEELKELETYFKDYKDLGYNVFEIKDLRAVDIVHDVFIAYPIEEKWKVFIIPKMEDHSFARIEKADRVEFRRMGKQIALKVKNEKDNPMIKKYLNEVTKFYKRAGYEVWIDEIKY